MSGHPRAESRLPTMATCPILRGMRVLLSIQPNPWGYKFKSEANIWSESKGVVDFNNL